MYEMVVIRENPMKSSEQLIELHKRMIASLIK